MKKVLSLFLAIIISVSALGSVVSASAQSGNTVSVNELFMASSKKKVTSKQRKAFFKQSAFVGSSIGVGQKMYFDNEGYKTVGKPTMLVRGCYSFYNDKHNRSKWIVTYKGTPMQAKKAIKKCKCKRVFIAMGTNDFHGNANVVYKDYVEYIEGIRKANPKVVIFIESTTSVTSNHQGKYLNSKNIKKLNDKMKTYCSKHKDMYFVNVSSKLNDKKGHLLKKYASDNYCHLTMAAYRIWTNQLVKFTDKLMLKEAEAKAAVAAAQKSKTEKKVKEAKKLVNKLEKSTVKSSLLKKLKKINVKKPSAPSAITSLTASDITTSSLKLTWKSVKCAGYQISMSSDESTWKSLETSYTKGNTYTVNKLNSNTEYAFRVRAYNKNSAGKTYTKWKTVKAKTDEKPRAIKITVLLPIDEGKSDTLNITVNNELVDTAEVTLSGGSYEFTTNEEYIGEIKITASLSEHGSATVTTESSECTLEVPLNGIPTLIDDND